jgi:hypothetical protein
MSEETQQKVEHSPNERGGSLLQAFFVMAGYAVALVPATLAYMSPLDHTDPTFGQLLREHNPAIPKNQK